VLDMECYRAGDRPFVLGVLALPTCPRAPAEARDYADTFLSARRELKKAKLPGTLLVGSRSTSRGALAGGES